MLAIIFYNSNIWMYICYTTIVGSIADYVAKTLSRI